MRYVIIPVLFLLFLCASCQLAGEKSDFNRALNGAVKDEKLSSKGMAEILREYSELREDDGDRAERYRLKVMNIIKMGGDSSHIDVARRQIFKAIKKV
jgi:uncharacterized protein (DUF2225 family)